MALRETGSRRAALRDAASAQIPGAGPIPILGQGGGVSPLLESGGGRPPPLILTKTQWRGEGGTPLSPSSTFDSFPYKPVLRA